MSYRDLEIWKLARELVVEIHKMSLRKIESLLTIRGERP